MTQSFDCIPASSIRDLHADTDMDNANPLSVSFLVHRGDAVGVMCPLLGEPFPSLVTAVSLAELVTVPASSIR